MSLSALLTAQAISVDKWDSTIIDHVLVEGDKMYLNAYNNFLIPREELLFCPIDLSVYVHRSLLIWYIKNMYNYYYSRHQKILILNV